MCCRRSWSLYRSAQLRCYHPNKKLTHACSPRSCFSNLRQGKVYYTVVVGGTLGIFIFSPTISSAILMVASGKKYPPSVNPRSPAPILQQAFVRSYSILNRNSSNQFTTALHQAFYPCTVNKIEELKFYSGCNRMRFPLLTSHEIFVSLRFNMHSNFLQQL